MLAVIGDIHGCYITFYKILKKLIKNYKIKKFIFVGDLVDRGNNSKEVINEIISLKKDYEVILLLGNHEDMMIDYILDEKRYGERVWFENGGYKTVRSFSETLYNLAYFNFEDIRNELKLIMEKELKFILDAKLFYTIKNPIKEETLFFSHAGIQYPNISPFDQLKNLKDPHEISTKSPYIWSRNVDKFKKKVNGYIFIHGHTPVQILKGSTYSKPFVNFSKNNKEIISINIDTGCVYGGFLSAMIIDEVFEFEFIKERYCG